MDEFKDSETILIADVDCTTAEGNPLCETMGVEGYPTLKYGDPNALEKYTWARDYDSLKKFVETELGPTCGPYNLELCNDAQKGEIARLRSLSIDELDKVINEKEATIAKAEGDLKDLLAALNKMYKKAKQEKEKTVQEVRESGLSVAKSIKAEKHTAKTDL
jgi:uncharacterized coiled-coil protein SlyX